MASTWPLAHDLHQPADPLLRAAESVAFKLCDTLAALEAKPLRKRYGASKSLQCLGTAFTLLEQAHACGQIQRLRQANGQAYHQLRSAFKGMLRKLAPWGECGFKPDLLDHADIALWCRGLTVIIDTRSGLFDAHDLQLSQTSVRTLCMVLQNRALDLGLGRKWSSKELLALLKLITGGCRENVLGNQGLAEPLLKADSMMQKLYAQGLLQMRNWSLGEYPAQDGNRKLDSTELGLALAQIHHAMQLLPMDEGPEMNWTWRQLLPKIAIGLLQRGRTLDDFVQWQNSEHETKALLQNSGVQAETVARICRLVTDLLESGMFACDSGDVKCIIHGLCTWILALGPQDLLANGAHTLADCAGFLRRVSVSAYQEPLPQLESPARFEQACQHVLQVLRQHGADFFLDPAVFDKLPGFVQAVGTLPRQPVPPYPPGPAPEPLPRTLAQVQQPAAVTTTTTINSSFTNIQSSTLPSATRPALVVRRRGREDDWPEEVAQADNPIETLPEPSARPVTATRPVPKPPIADEKPDTHSKRKSGKKSKPSQVPQQKSLAANEAEARKHLLEQLKTCAPEKMLTHDGQTEPALYWMIQLGDPQTIVRKFNSKLTLSNWERSEYPRVLRKVLGDKGEIPLFRLRGFAISLQLMLLNDYWSATELAELLQPDSLLAPQALQRICQAAGLLRADELWPSPGSRLPRQDLYIAALKAGKPQALKTLLNQHPLKLRKLAAPLSGDTALMLAVEGGGEMIKACLKQEPDCAQLEVRNARGMTAVTRAIQANQPESLRILLQHAAKSPGLLERILFQGSADCGNLLNMACEPGAGDSRSGCLKVLLEAAMQSNCLPRLLLAPGKCGSTPLSTAARHNEGEACALLLDAGMEREQLECRDDLGMQAFLLACQFGHARLLKTLMERLRGHGRLGAQLSSVNFQECNALWMAIDAASMPSLLLLIEELNRESLLQAALLHRDRLKRSPLHLAVKLNQPGTADFLLSTACAKEQLALLNLDGASAIDLAQPPLKLEELEGASLCVLQNKRLALRIPKIAAWTGRPGSGMNMYTLVRLHHEMAHGNGEAPYILGVKRLLGDGLAHNPMQAVMELQLAIQRGFAPAHAELGFCHAQGIAVPRSWENAVECFQAGAALNDAKAQYGLGFCHQHGLGAPSVNMDQALHWYDKAIAQKHVEAITAKGKILLARSAPAERQQGLTLLRESAADGHAAACMELYWHLTTLSDGREEAIAWLRKAADMKLGKACHVLGRLLAFDTQGSAAQKVEGIEFLRQAARQNIIMACHDLAAILTEFQDARLQAEGRRWLDWAAALSPPGNQDTAKTAVQAQGTNQSDKMPNS